MPWVKLDETFYDHPKVLNAGPLAAWLYVCGLGYCNRHLTDGFIANAVVRRLADVDDAPHLAAQLIEAGLWELAAGGYRVHDYHDYQPTREHVEAVSAVRAEAGRKGGVASSEARAKQSADPRLDVSFTHREAKFNSGSESGSESGSGPESGTDPEVVSHETNARAREAPATQPAKPARYSAPFEAFWRAYPRRENKPGAWLAWQKIALPRGPTGEAAEEILAGVATWMRSDQWARGIYPHASTWLNGRQWEDEPAMVGPPRASPAGKPSRMDNALEGIRRALGHDGTSTGAGDGPVVRPVAPPGGLLGRGSGADHDLPSNAWRPV